MRGFDRDLIRGGHYGQRSRDLLDIVWARFFKSLATLAKPAESLAAQPLSCIRLAIYASHAISSRIVQSHPKV
jgi:hypothetical protein